jgi:hypothetical protein
MKWTVAFKAFFKAFKDPEKGQQFIEETDVPKQVDVADTAHLRLLSYLQQTGRLIDFLKEDIAPFSDAQVGAAVRKIHQDCQQILEDLVTIRPLREEGEGSLIQIPKGYNPSEVKIVGNVKGEPPFSGVVVHRGWKVHKRSLPKKIGEQTVDVICPAEIEIK